MPSKKVKVAPALADLYRHRPITTTTMALAKAAGYPSPSAVSQIFTGREAFAATPAGLARVATVARVLGLAPGVPAVVDAL